MDQAHLCAQGLLPALFPLAALAHHEALASRRHPFCLAGQLNLEAQCSLVPQALPEVLAGLADLAWPSVLVVLFSLAALSPQAALAQRVSLEPLAVPFSQACQACQAVLEDPSLLCILAPLEIQVPLSIPAGQTMQGALDRQATQGLQLALLRQEHHCSLAGLASQACLGHRSFQEARRDQVVLAGLGAQVARDGLACLGCQTHSEAQAALVDQAARSSTGLNAKSATSLRLVAFLSSSSASVLVPAGLVAQSLSWPWLQAHLLCEWVGRGGTTWPYSLASASALKRDSVYFLVQFSHQA